MVSPFTLGLFAPLPLAMMIPFMATQSLAMGEAFGKSFQYGKRKISSMTNEEFNKLTFQNLMDEQTANIKSIIPKLHEQMNDSNAMQADIFREMTKLIPAFIDGLTKGAGDIFGESTGDTPLGNIKIPTPNIVPASHNTEQANVQEVTIINASHGGESTIGTPIATHTETSSNPTSATKNAFANKIKSWNTNTIREYQHSGLMTPWQSKIIDERQIQIINANKPTIDTSPINTSLTPTQSAQKTYLAKTISLQQTIIKAQGEINSLTARAKAMGVGGSSVVAKAKAIATAKKSNAIKQLQNFITQSRNNLTLKSVANADWNKRIWIV